jgi:bifunctional UDP-N-acetylglucosamine pyrophosphorylase/glucosamine-1-phosphate N-acetyltransferase
MKAYVLAAGRGERLLPLTENRPKHMLPIAGKPLLEHLLLTIKRAGITEIIVLVGHKRESINAYFEDGSRLGLNLTYLVQSRITGTASALAEAEPFLKDDEFLLVYGDLFVSPNVLSKFSNSTSKDTWAMATVRLEDASRFGVINAESGVVTRITEKPQFGGKRGDKVNAGIYRLKPTVFDAVRRTGRSTRGERELTDSLQDLISRGEKMHAFELSAQEWLDIGRPWDLLEANERALKLIDRRIEGVLEDRVIVEGNVIIEKGAMVRAGTYIEGPVCIGANSRIGPNSRIRPHTAVGVGCTIGESCDVKNSIIMDHTEIPHLSYVGDSIVGEGCNLGAGTITANLRFDDEPVKVTIKNRRETSGRRKLGAILGDYVKTGINVSILPGTKIGCGSWIEPGAIVRKDVPPHSRLTVRQTLTATTRIPHRKRSVHGR